MIRSTNLRMSAILRLIGSFTGRDHSPKKNVTKSNATRSPTAIQKQVIVIFMVWFVQVFIALHRVGSNDPDAGSTITQCGGNMPFRPNAIARAASPLNASLYFSDRWFDS